MRCSIIRTTCFYYLLHVCGCMLILFSTRLMFAANNITTKGLTHLNRMIRHCIAIRVFYINWNKISYVDADTAKSIGNHPSMHDALFGIANLM